MSYNTISDPQAPDVLDVREELYNEYGLPHQSLEDFCNESAEQYGDNWIYLLSR